MEDDPAPPPEPAHAAVTAVDLRDYVDFSPAKARRTRVLATDALALDLWCIEPQQSTGVLEFAGQDVTYTVVGGRSWFVTDQGEVGLDPLGALLVPAGVIHGIDNRGADPLIVSAAISPAGDDTTDAPVTDDALAIRDDAKYGRTRARIRDAVGRMLGN